MTTAARPTFEPARGGRGKGEGDLSALSKQYSSRDLPSHNKLKRRLTSQDSLDELREKDFKRDLVERERQATRERAKDRGSRSDSKKSRLDQLSTTNLDADDPVDEEDSDDSNESDDEDDTAELLAELQRIKKERAQEEAKKELEKKAEEERIRTENILQGNPLLQQSSNFQVKRRWDDDVVFKNCAKGIPEKGKEGKFINDTLRSEFHKKFMNKYIK
ncbi:spliceosome-associated protein CWC15 homolog [Xenia sp. Carnegie-2017]|uniref:spliceosome-associated protein CWC15 homolog n=1 Tax=Xenia sp. Carnegie-2017 TaxID=2897299 RepID=UPI001F0435E5|nr:spliceosome-associated protein CWC15 homolog [Xenia sp. Carnegie-2017]